MTDTAEQVAPEGAGTLDAGAMPNANGSEQNGSANPFDGLDADIVGALEKMGVKDIPGLAKAATDKEAFIQKTIRYPGEDDPEKLQSFFAKVRPESPEKYTLPTEIPEGVPYDEGLAQAFAGIAHEHGLTDAQFQGIMGGLLKNDAIAGLEGKVAENEQKQLSERANTAASSIAEKFGGAGSEQYNEAVSKVNALYEQTPDVGEALQALGLLDPKDGAVLDANVFNLLHALSSGAQVQPDGKVDATPNSDGDVGIDPETGLVTDQMKAAQLYNSDPERYRQMTAMAKQ